MKWGLLLGMSDKYRLLTYIWISIKKNYFIFLKNNYFYKRKYIPYITKGTKGNANEDEIIMNLVKKWCYVLV